MSALREALLKDNQDLDTDDDITEGIERAAEPARPQALDGLVLRDTTVDEFADYRGVTFTAPVVMRDVRFLKGFSFDGATFLGQVRLAGVANDKSKGSSASFAGAKFRQSVKVSRTSALYLADFSAAVFSGPAIFKGVRFYASARFDGAIFEGPANFNSVTFNGSGNFKGARFDSSSDFERATFRYRLSHARFSGVRFEQLAAFNEVQFAGDADFSDAVFAAGASFPAAQFSLLVNNGESGSEEMRERYEVPDGDQADIIISFDRATFVPDDDGEVVSFEGAKFGDRNFRRAMSFNGAHFRPKTLPRKNDRFIANFREIVCLGTASFREAEFYESVSADLSHARFEDDLDLGECRFLADAIFEKGHFKQDVLLSHTVFGQLPDFRQATFTHFPDLSQATLPTKVSARTRKERKSIAPRLGALRRIASRTDDKRTEFSLLVRELKLEGGIASRLYGLVSNFGQSWLRPALWLAIFAIVVFPLLHLGNSGRLPSSTADAVTIAQGRWFGCADGGEGSALAAALELSIKNSLIVAAQNENRSAKIADCLGVAGAVGARGVVAAALEASQTVLTLVLVFFVGAAIRRRLQMR